MLEGIRRLGKEARLVEELGRLQVGERHDAVRLGQLGNGLQEGKGTSLPMTAAVCSRRFSSPGSRSMRAARTACTVAGTWMLGSSLAQAIGPRVTDQHLRLDQRPDAFLQEEGVALGALDQALFERLEPGVISQEGMQQGLGRSQGAAGRAGAGCSRFCSSSRGDIPDGS